jgi:hypothetical protein
MIDKLLNIDSDYFLILDFLEDTSINYKYLYERINNLGFLIIDKKEFKKKEEQIFDDFVGKTYISLLIKR